MLVLNHIYGALDLLTVAIEVIKIHNSCHSNCVMRAANSDAQSHSCHILYPLKN